MDCRVVCGTNDPLRFKARSYTWSNFLCHLLDVYIPSKIFIDMHAKRFSRWNLLYGLSINQTVRRFVKWTCILNLCRDPININSVLELLSVNLFAMSHSLTIVRSWFNSLLMVSILLLAKVKWNTTSKQLIAWKITIYEAFFTTIG